MASEVENNTKTGQDDLSVIEHPHPRQRSTSDREPPWQRSMKKMNDRLAYIWKHGSLGDVMLLVGRGPASKRFVAHSLVLSMCSEKFAAIFNNNVIGSRTTLTMQNDDPDAMATFLRFAYLDELEFQSLEQATSTGALSKKYRFQELLERSSAFVAKRLKANVACQVYEYAEKVRDQQLEEACEELFGLQFAHVVTSSGFLTSSPETVGKVLSYRSKEGNETMPDATLFNALYRWAQEDCCRNGTEINPKTIRQALESFLYYVNFTSFTAEEVASGPAKCGILTYQELSAIMLNIAQPGSAPMPFTSQTAVHAPEQPLSLLTCGSHNFLRYRLETFLFRKKPTAVAQLKVCKHRDVTICGVEFLLLAKADYWTSKKRLLSGGTQVDGEIIVVTTSETFQEIVHIPMDTNPEKTVMLSRPVVAPRDSTVVISLMFLRLSKKLFVCSECRPPTHDQIPELILDTDRLDQKTLHFEKILYQ